MSELQTAIEAVQGAQTQEQAFKKFCDAVAGYGYDRVGFSLMTDHPSIGQEAFHWLSSSYPDDWMAHYTQHDYQEIDPVFQLILAKPGPFFWSDAVSELSRTPRFDAQPLDDARNMMLEAADVGLADGIGVSVVNAWGEVAGFGISRSVVDDDRDIRSLADIYLLSATFHEKYLGFHETREIPNLTQREKEILCWSASGKTDWDIAEITGISRATVRFHWNNIFRKMMVNNKMSATIKAIMRKLIVPDSVRPNTQ